MVCTSRSCLDNPLSDRREIYIMDTLTAGAEMEGADMRAIDRAFFEGFDETDR